MPKKKTLAELIKEKLDILENSDLRFVKGVKRDEKQILKEVLAIITSLNSLNGRIVNDETNLQKLTSLKKDLTKIIAKTKYQSRVSKFLFEFDRIERLSKEIILKTNTITRKQLNKLKLNAEKQIVVQEVADNMIAPKTIDARIKNPIQKLLYRHITLGSNIEDAKQSLSDFIIGSQDQQLGLMSRNVSTIAQTSISEYSGTVNKVIADEFELDGFLIVGSLIKTSRENCVEMINGSGRFKSLAVAPGMYRKEDIPRIIELAKNRSGWRKETTPETYLIYKNGWNERHDFIPVNVTEKSIKQAKKLISNK